MKEALLWTKEEDHIRCNLCHRRCLIPEGKSGFCLVRKNINGTLYTLNYGKIVGLNIDPIEKKPFFHFYPGSKALSLSCPSCNFACVYCCNYEISQVFRDRNFTEVVGENFTPEEIVNICLKYNTPIISYTYTEPTVFFEFAYDVAKLASKHKIKNTFVSNGYMTPEAVDLISKYLDAIVVDFKGSGNKEFYRKYIGVSDPEKIFETLLELKRKKVFIEITDLIVPKIGDFLEDVKNLCRWIVENLGEETPVHFIRFFPTYKLLDIPETPVETLEKAIEIAKEEGLQYVYIGNVPGHPYENTYCPYCSKVVVRRYSVYLEEINLTEDAKCKYCGKKLNFVLNDKNR